MPKPEFSMGPAVNVGSKPQCSKLPKTAAAEFNTIKDESLLKVVSTILDQDEPEEESDDDVEELTLSSSLHNRSGTIGEPLGISKPIELPNLLSKSLSELSPKKDVKTTKPLRIVNKQGMRSLKIKNSN